MITNRARLPEHLAAMAEDAIFKANMGVRPGEITSCQEVGRNTSWPLENGREATISVVVTVRERKAELDSQDGSAIAETESPREGVDA